jgi:formate/nitrite transporter FocA (FNT family)
LIRILDSSTEAFIKQQINILKRLIGVALLAVSGGLYIPIGYLLLIAGWDNFPDMDYLYFFYAAMVYLFSWFTLLSGIYLAGPELVAKLNEFYNVNKKKFLGRKE